MSLSIVRKILPCCFTVLQNHLQVVCSATVRSTNEFALFSNTLIFKDSDT